MFLLTVALIWFVAAVTPGPNFLVVVRCALSGTRAVALAAVAGTLTGTALWGVAGWLGITALFAVAPFAYTALKVVGGIYIAFLGVRLLWRNRNRQVVADVRQVAPLGAWAAYRLGLVTNLANPKSAVFVASLFAAALPEGAHWSHGPIAVVMMVAISASWYGALVTSLTHPRVASAYARARRVIDLCTGAIFIAFGSRLAFDR
ncbi:LysE family translocator [Acuticoccus mangrovi]|uniref:LysE family transporter n=1 Tax=Acuticoccus mangrovi TaxID=2796142 RepID=A0A934MGJ9_9HYPH|nr:LysE family transporter [Acuticoccus mangrovi]MBJ3776668.1 LysE family transporter [Acuticoccus mangrovi]